MLSMKSLTESQMDYIVRTKQAADYAKAEKNMDHAKIADIIGVDRSTFTNYTRSRPMPQKYQAKFCVAIGINEKWLVSGADPMVGDDLMTMIGKLNQQNLESIKSLVEFHLQRQEDSGH